MVIIVVYVDDIIFESDLEYMGLIGCERNEIF